MLAPQKEIQRSYPIMKNTNWQKITITTLIITTLFLVGVKYFDWKTNGNDGTALSSFTPTPNQPKPTWQKIAYPGENQQITVSRTIENDKRENAFLEITFPEDGTFTIEQFWVDDVVDYIQIDTNPITGQFDFITTEGDQVPHISAAVVIPVKVNDKLWIAIGNLRGDLMGAGISYNYK